jgi:hypothetical protein
MINIISLLPQLKLIEMTFQTTKIPNYYTLKGMCIIFWIIIFFACKKDEIVPGDYRCTNLITDSRNVQLLPDKSMDSIRYFFNKNNLGYDNLQFWRYFEDSGYKYAGAYQFVNNLKVFTDYWVFEFNRNDSLTYLSGDTISNFNLTDKPRLSPAQVRYIYIQAIKSDDWYKNDTEIQDSCINLEFGYYNLNSGTGNHISNYTTAWLAYPHNGDYPMGYIDDLRGRLITYSNGIIINKK